LVTHGPCALFGNHIRLIATQRDPIIASSMGVILTSMVWILQSKIHMTLGACHRQFSNVYPRTAFATYSAPQAKAGVSFVKTFHTHYIIQNIFSSRVMRTYVPGSCRINLMRTRLTCSFIVITLQCQLDQLHHQSRDTDTSHPMLSVIRQTPKPDVMSTRQLNRREMLFPSIVLRPVDHKTHKILPFFFRDGPAHHPMFQTTLIRTVVGVSV